jgi:hypothetical protein
VYFINCVQICGCWQSDVSDTVRCVWQWWQQTVLQRQWGATGCLYCETMLWVRLGPGLQHTLCQLTTQPNTLPIQTVTLWDAAQFPAQQQQLCHSQCAVSVRTLPTDATLETRTLFYLTNIVCNFHPQIRRACGRSVELVTLVRSTERREVAIWLCWSADTWCNSTILVQQHNTGTAALPVQQHNTSTAAQYRFSSTTRTAAQYWYSSTIPVQQHSTGTALWKEMCKLSNISLSCVTINMDSTSCNSLKMCTLHLTLCV